MARWKEIGAGRPCDVMIDTGMNRLGLRPTDIDALEGLDIDTLHSHLACADEDTPLNVMQLERFRAVVSVSRPGATRGESAPAFASGATISFDLVRPGLALYGGVPREEAEGNIRQVARVEAQIVQRRTIPEGETCGYGATFTARRTPRRRSSTSAMPTAICAASRRTARHSPANLRCRCSAGCRWT